MATQWAEKEMTTSGAQSSSTWGSFLEQEHTFTESDFEDVECDVVEMMQAFTNSPVPSPESSRILTQFVLRYVENLVRTAANISAANKEAQLGPNALLVALDHDKRKRNRVMHALLSLRELRRMLQCFDDSHHSRGATYYDRGRQSPTATRSSLHVSPSASCTRNTGTEQVSAGFRAIPIPPRQ